MHAIRLQNRIRRLESPIFIFDLSVYDVFGILGAGGKLVLPDPEYGKDPAHWIHWLNHENITVWNSVPAFVEMLAEYEEYQRQVTSQSLRLVMMSGDWVPVSLPGRIRNLFQNVEIVALGGATEGSIWSNHFEIPEVVPEDWEEYSVWETACKPEVLCSGSEYGRLP